MLHLRVNKKQIIIFIFYGKIEVFSVNHSLWIGLGLTKILLIVNNLQLSLYYFLVALGGCVQLEPQNNTHIYINNHMSLIVLEISKLTTSSLNQNPFLECLSPHTGLKIDSLTCIYLFFYSNELFHNYWQ